MNKSAESTSALPDFVVIGAMKCATSSIHDQLSQQPGISMSDPKEPNFFSDDENWALGISSYKALFEVLPSNDFKGESSTHYSKLPTYQECAQRLHNTLPHVKLVYVMRDPIDRVVSQFVHEWSMRVFEEGCSIDEAIRKYSLLVDYSKYAMQLQPYIQLFGKDSILPVFFECLMANPQNELERIAKHIGYAESVCWQENHAKNISMQRQRRSPLLNKLLDIRLVQVARRTLLPESVRARIRSKWTMSERPEISEESRAYLYEHLDPDMAILGNYFGIDLCCSNFKASVLSGRTLSWVQQSESHHG
jgi:Sulfotransferase domain